MLFYKDKPQNKDSHPEYLFNVLITTYEACVADDFLDRNTYPWEYVIFDEALRLRGPKTQKYFFKAKPPRFMLIASNPIFVETSPSHDAPMPDDGVEDVIATGSAVLSCDERKKKNILGDAWFLLNYVDKTAFPNYRTFEATDPEKMKALVSEYYLRRRRVYGQPQSESPSRVVFSQPKSKQHVPIHIEAVLADATPLQKAFLWRTYARNVPFLRKRKEPLCSVMLAMQDVSKCLIHPKLKEDNEGIKDSYFIDEKDGSSLQHTNDSNSSDNNDNDDDPSNSKMSGAPANESDISNSNSTKAALESAPKSSSGEMSSQNESTSKHLEIAAELKRQERQLLINREKEVMNNIFQDSGLACATSGKFLLLKHLIPGILEKGRKLLIFSNYTEALNVLYDELLSKMLGEKYPHYGKVLDETMHGNDVVMAIKSASASGPYAMLASTGLKPVWVLKLLSVFDIIVFLDLEIAESQWTENSLVNLVQMSLPPVDNAPKNIYYLLMRDSFESLYFKERCFTDDRYKSLCSRKAWVEALAKCSMSPFFKTEPAGARVVADFESVNGVNINDNNFWDTVFRVGDKRSFVDRVSAAEKADADKTFDHELIKHIIEDVQEVKCAEPGSVHNELTDAYESQESSCAITDTIPPPLPKNDDTQHEEQSPDEKGSAHSYSLKPNDESGSTKPTAVSVVEDKAETTTLQQFQLLPPPSKKKRRCSQQETASPPSEHSAQGLKVQIESSEQWKISEVERVIKGLISFGWGAWDKVQKEKLLTKTPESIVRISYALLSAILNAVPLGSSLVLAQKILGFRIDLPQDLSSELGLAQIFCPWHIMRADSLDMGGTLLGTGQSSVAATVGLGPGHFFEDDPVFRDPALLVNIREGGLDKLNSIALATEVNRLANAIANGYELRPLRPSTSQSWWTPGDDKQLIIGMQKWGIKPCFLEKIFRDSGLTFSVTFSKNRQTQKQCKQIPSPQAILLRARMVLNANRAWILPIVAAVDNAVAAAEQIASHSALDRVVSSLWAEKRDGSSGNCGDSCPAWWCSAADIGLVRGFSKLRGFTAKYLRADPSHLKAGKWDDENSSLEEALWVKVAEADPSHVVSTKYINAKAQITAKPGPMVFAPKDLLRRAGFFSLRGAVNRLFEICNVFEEWYCINYMSVVNATVLTTHDLPQNNRPLPVTGATAVPIAKAAAVPASSTYPKGKYPVTFVSFAPTTEGERRSVVVLNRTFLPICADINTALLFGSHRSANSDNGSSKLEELTVDLGMLRYSSATASLVLPIAIEGGLEVQDMGIIVPSFACESYVYPLGYKASRVINNPEKKKDDLIRCVCSIDINESAIVKTPLFRVAVPGTCVEFKGETPSEACTGLLVHWGYNPSSIPPGFGEEFFGLSNPLVVHVIQSSYRAALCVAYKPRHIKTIGQVLKVN